MTEIQNPYWDIVKALPGDSIYLRYLNEWKPRTFSENPSDTFPNYSQLRRIYTFAIPDPETIKFVTKWGTSKIVEMGAGTGYWAWLLAQLGVDVLAYDIAPPNQQRNKYFNPEKDNHFLDREIFYSVKYGSPIDLQQYQDRTLFLCWPPFDNDMATQCLYNYTGQRIVYIGEAKGGCTADDTFFKELAKYWREIDCHIGIQWAGINDYVSVLEPIVHAGSLVED